MSWLFDICAKSFALRSNRCCIVAYFKLKKRLKEILYLCEHYLLFLSNIIEVESA